MKQITGIFLATALAVSLGACAQGPALTDGTSAGPASDGAVKHRRPDWLGAADSFPAQR